MFYIKKCAEKGCKRSGNVCLTVNGKYCNLHDEEGQARVDEEQRKAEEERDENGARLEDNDNQLEEQDE